MWSDLQDGCRNELIPDSLRWPCECSTGAGRRKRASPAAAAALSWKLAAKASVASGLYDRKSLPCQQDGVFFLPPPHSGDTGRAWPQKNAERFQLNQTPEDKSEGPSSRPRTHRRTATLLHHNQDLSPHNFYSPPKWETAVRRWLAACVILFK